MIKNILAGVGLMFTGFLAYGQTTAVDFTATDCASVSHNLYSELSTGKIVVLVWVMPCGTCISDAKAAYDAAQSFASSNPGKVLYWLSDDAGNTGCSTLSNWASTNSIGAANLTVFDNASAVIPESNFGGTGMPHVVVMAGADHHIYYNKLNGSNDGAAITAAISQAITTGVSNVQNQRNEVRLFPNPATNKLSVGYSLDQATDVSLEIYSLIGSKVLMIEPERQGMGAHELTVNFSGRLASGVYFLKLNAGNHSQTIKFTVSN